MNAKLVKALNVFMSVADTGSLSQAAKAMHMTVSAISQQLRKLEDDIGQQLVNRNSRHLSLTEAGRIYYRTSESVLEMARQGQQEIDALIHSPSGELKILAPEGFGGGLLSKPLQQLLQSSQRISVTVTLGEGYEDIVSTGADLALGLAPIENDGFKSCLLATWPQMLCVAPSHPLAQQQIAHPEALVKENFMVYEHLPSHELTGVNNATYLLSRPKLSVNSMQALIQFTVDGLGYAVLPQMEVQHYLDKGELVQILPEWTLPDYRVFAVVADRITIPAKTREAITLLESYFASL
ncbi:LysR family transcriptional regulator [Alteromonas lipolytica]|uniref:LysR family transcriptional regulator n=1 Tax=Alteromonas lipolytica TaxID=1856405 RepID=A0A1E8FA32_9ALTE|nr:LysR family transcriptional regulator [Alteromonas lipolytica]OFI32771.1 LysR family transcriptional regulator [Alteromonas lipolytica]GGF73174.1 LysR family transcriptional regulator [Alteromonas lipolytica]